jgi:hypothetical protein
MPCDHKLWDLIDFTNKIIKCRECGLELQAKELPRTLLNRTQPAFKAEIAEYQLFLTKYEAQELAKYAEERIRGCDYLISHPDAVHARDKALAIDRILTRKKFWEKIYNKLSSLLGT